MKHGDVMQVRFKRLRQQLAKIVDTEMIDTDWLAIGLVQGLQFLAINNAYKGDIGAKMDDPEIAAGVGWLGEPEVLIRALLVSGYLAESEEHRLVLVDWDKDAPKFVAGNAAKNGGFAGGSKDGPIGASPRDRPIGASLGESPIGPSSGEPPTGASPKAAPPNQPTNPTNQNQNQTEPKPNPDPKQTNSVGEARARTPAPEESAPAEGGNPTAPADARVEPAGFAAVWEAYPKSTHRPNAIREYRRALLRLSDHDDPAAFLLDRVEAFAASDQGKQAMQFVPRLDGWLESERYHDDPAGWRREKEAPTTMSKGEAATASLLNFLGDDSGCSYGDGAASSSRPTNDEAKLLSASTEGQA